MTINQYEHNREQIEAHWRDFLTTWECLLLPWLVIGGTSETDIAIIKHESWRRWLETDGNLIRQKT